MGSLRDHYNQFILEDWYVLRMVARCAQWMGHGELDVVEVVLRKELLEDLREDDQTDRP